MRSFRSKPVGWRGESYRHSLAARGLAARGYSESKRSQFSGIMRKDSLFCDIHFRSKENRENALKEYIKRLDEKEVKDEFEEKALVDSKKELEELQ